MFKVSYFINTIFFQILICAFLTICEEADPIYKLHFIRFVGSDNVKRECNTRCSKDSDCDIVIGEEVTASYSIQTTDVIE